MIWGGIIQLKTKANLENIFLCFIFRFDLLLILSKFKIRLFPYLLLLDSS
jgi:hypothetical protein